MIRIHTANGAGYGDPSRRPPERVLADVLYWYLTPERARTCTASLASAVERKPDVEHRPPGF